MQTSYSVDPARGVVGAVASINPKIIRARAANGVVRPGQYVVLNGLECNHPAAEPTTQVRGGIAIRNPYKQSDGVYADGEMVDILEDGDIWVASEVAASIDTRVFVRCTAAGQEQLGALRIDADAGDAFMIPGLFFRSAGTTLVLCEVKKSAEVT